MGCNDVLYGGLLTFCRRQHYNVAKFEQIAIVPLYATQ